MVAKRLASFLVAVALGLGAPISALEPEANAVFVRVVDVGAGLCCVAKLPGDRYMIYDAGTYEDDGATAIEAIREIIPAGSRIDLLVLSHTDADHVAAVPEICAEYRVKRVIRPGRERTSKAWSAAVAAVREEVRTDRCDDVNIRWKPVRSGKRYNLGTASATVVFGLSEPPADWIENYNLNKGEQNNVGSIVVRLDYDGKSILFCGDSVGRHLADPDDSCIAAEKAMVDNAARVRLKSDVIVAGHHGANNSSSTAFVELVDPDFVIFPAGHKYQHPTAGAAKRFMATGVANDHFFRTDRGDNEGRYEWTEGNTDKPDGVGDDNVDILLRKGVAEPVVEYATSP